METSVIPFDQSPIFNSISNIEKRRNRNYVLFLIYLQNFTQMITSYFPKNFFEKHISISLCFISMDLLRKSTSIPIQPSAIKFAKSVFPCTCFSPLLTRLSPRPISNSQLHTLLCFHLCPIYLVVFKGSYSRRRDISSWGGLHA